MDDGRPVRDLVRAESNLSDKPQVATCCHGLKYTWRFINRLIVPVRVLVPIAVVFVGFCRLGERMMHAMRRAVSEKKKQGAGDEKT
jgi:hypothetical protein